MTTPKPPAGQSVQFTPGPWSYHLEEPSREWALVMAGGKGGQIVANVNSKSCPDSTSAPAFRAMPAEANAKLIAASPDLLEACREMLRLDDDGIETAPGEFVPIFATAFRVKLLAAIARATQ